MARNIVFPERMEACRNHPEKAEIFWLEQMLIEAGYPYYFNIWEDLRPVFGGEPDGDPESIDWNLYGFRIELGQPAGYGYSELSVCLDRDGSGLLEIRDLRTEDGEPRESIGPEDGKLFRGLTAEQAMEMIEKFFE